MRILLVVVLCLSMCGICASAEQYTIEEIREQAPDYWSSVCEVSGVSFNAPVYVPEVNRMPILYVHKLQISPEKTERFGEEVKLSMPGGLSLNHSSSYHAKYGTNMVSFAQECIQNIWSEKALDSANVWAENQPLSLADALNAMDELVQELYGNLNIKMLPYQVKRFSGFLSSKRAGTYEFGGEYPFGDLTGVGQYEIYAHEVLRGIPVISGIYYAYYNESGHDKAERTNAWIRNLISQSRFSCNYMSADYYNFLGSTVFEESRMAIEDIPLCAYDKIIRSLEEMIEQGYIRNVYSLKLGYVIFADPQIDYPRNVDEVLLSDYAAVPTWVVECSYDPDITKGYEMDNLELRGPNAYDYIQHDEGYRTIMVNAQTGDVYNPTTKGTERYYMPPIQTWK